LMDRKLLDKYFNDSCSDEELDEVLTWFQTDEGQVFLEQQMEEEFSKAMNAEALDVYPKMESEKVFNRIQHSKQPHFNKGRWYAARVASILLLVAMLSSLLYWSGITAPAKQPPQPAFATYLTQAGQQNIFTLSDGTVIRLNDKSMLTVPAKLKAGTSTVTLEGEAYFEVASDPAHPFVVYANGSAVEVLGTKFNVKADSLADNVQVAVVEGKVSLKKEGAEESASALLTRNNFGLLDLDNGSITIEQVYAANYKSWVTNRLVYSGESLAKVSRQLEHLYNDKISFSTPDLKKFKLAADFERNDLETTITTIANTFDIRYCINGHSVTGIE